MLDVLNYTFDCVFRGDGMAVERVHRRLAAILAADVAGYTRLIRADEERTLNAVRSDIEEIFAPRAEVHAGRIFKRMGDGLLVEFSSVVDAVKFAVDVQTALAQRNSDREEDQQIRFRIGINLGDVVTEGDDLQGDGVNVAARLEELAPPSEILLSASTFEQVRDKLEYAFEDMGEQRLKNIERPVRTYRVVSGAASADKSTRASTHLFVWASWHRLAVVTSVIMIAAAGGLAIWRPWLPKIEPVSIERMAFALPDKPSIAILPFINLSEDPKQEYFVDGMTEDLITDLSKLSGLFVIARNSVFAYKGRSVKPRQVAEDLGVRYLLEGSVRRLGDRMRINAQLIDATTGGHLWAERYDGELSDVFGLQDKVIRQIVAELAVKLSQNEATNLAQRGTASAEAYDTFLKGWQNYLRQTPESVKIAIRHFERAAELDQNYARPHAALAASYWQIFRRFWHSEFGYRSVHGARAKAEVLLQRAQQTPTSLSYQVATAMLSLQGRHPEAIAEGGKAIGIDPNDADSYVALAGALSLAGNSKKALQQIKKAMRLNPHFQPFYLYELGLAEFGAGNFEAAVAALERATSLNPADRWSYRLLLAAYGHLGRTADAKRILDQTSRNWSGYDPLTVSAVQYWYPYKNPADRERLAVGLRAANVPE